MSLQKKEAAWKGWGVHSDKVRETGRDEPEKNL